MIWISGITTKTSTGRLALGLRVPALLCTQCTPMGVGVGAPTLPQQQSSAQTPTILSVITQPPAMQMMGRACHTACRAHHLCACPMLWHANMPWGGHDRISTARNWRVRSRIALRIAGLWAK